MIKLRDLYNSIVEQSSMEAGEPDTGWLPKGTSRKLGYTNKPDEWYVEGGYTQLDFPSADDIFGIGNKPDFEAVKRKTPEEDSLAIKAKLIPTTVKIKNQVIGWK